MSIKQGANCELPNNLGWRKGYIYLLLTMFEKSCYMPTFHYPAHDLIHWVSDKSLTKSDNLLSYQKICMCPYFKRGKTNSVQEQWFQPHATFSSFCELASCKKPHALEIEHVIVNSANQGCFSKSQSCMHVQLHS